jgi:hypothetical protein
MTYPYQEGDPRYDGAAHREAIEMATEAEAVAQAVEKLQALEPDHHWYLSKGRARPGEPLYAVGITRVNSNGVAEDDFAAIAEADDIMTAAEKAIANLSN